jgi:hypothetical protein
MNTKQRRNEELTESRRGPAAIKFYDTENDASPLPKKSLADDLLTDIGELEPIRFAMKEVDVVYKN